MKLFIVVAETNSHYLLTPSDQQSTIMTLIRALIIAIALIGVTQTYDLRLGESLDLDDDEDLEYRPWRNDTSTTWISLEGMGIQTVNSMFRLNIPNLKWLVMDENAIQHIPSNGFRFFPNLTYISLVRNQIRTFDSNAFGYLDNLQVLDLDHNRIGLLDYSIFDNLAHLKRLYVRNCAITSFDVPLHMDNLSHLYLSGNELQIFYIINESTLTNLYLNNNQLWYVSLSKLKSLVYLNLSNNWLTRIVRRSEVPAAYFARNFDRRNYYDKSYYRQQYIENSEDVSALFLDNASDLEYLIVSSNELSKIDPDTFLDTESLIHVDLSNNQISEVYAGTFNSLLQLEEILLNSNQIKQINHRAFVNLPNLKTISLKNNRIDDLDEDAFTKLNSSANEVYLFLDNNQIHTLRRGSFSGIIGLKHIGLSNNRIKIISSNTFVNLPNLESIIIENQSRDVINRDINPYDHSLERLWRPLPLREEVIESGAFFNLTNLTSITIRGNLFRIIKAQAFHTLPKLTLLDLSNNSIATLSSTAFDDLPAIENLFLGNNLISEIGPETFPKQLKHLELASNRVCPNFSCWHVGELYQLETLDVSGIIERFKVEDFAGLPDNLTVIVGNTVATSNVQALCD